MKRKMELFYIPLFCMFFFYSFNMTDLLAQSNPPTPLEWHTYWGTSLFKHLPDEGRAVAIANGSVYVAGFGWE